MAEPRLRAGGRLIRLVTIAVFAAGAATAQSAEEADLRPAPDWFVAAVVNLTTAEQLVRSCPSLSLDGQAAQAHTAEVLARLDAEGFDTSRPDGGMAPSREAFVELQAAFVARHGLEGDVTEEMVCAAGRAEIADGTGIGGFLTEAGE